MFLEITTFIKPSVYMTPTLFSFLACSINAFYLKERKFERQFEKKFKGVVDIPEVNVYIYLH